MVSAASDCSTRQASRCVHGSSEREAILPDTCIGIPSTCSAFRWLLLYLGPHANRTLHVRRLPALAHQFGSLCEILFATEQSVLLELGELAQLFVEVRLVCCLCWCRFDVNKEPQTTPTIVGRSRSTDAASTCRRDE